MSYIDTFEHEYLGVFAGINLYRPLVQVNPKDTSDGQFSCDPSTFVLGGGYLEHPGLVVRDSNYAAAQFISEWINVVEEDPTKPFSDTELEKWTEITHDYMHDKYSDGITEYEILDFTQWSMRHYSEFYTACKSSVMRNPFIETERYNEFENWLLSNFGELVVLSYPELISNDSIASITNEIDRFLFGNVCVLPAGYPVYWGLKKENDKLKPGTHAWNVKRRI